RATWRRCRASCCSPTSPSTRRRAASSRWKLPPRRTATLTRRKSPSSARPRRARRREGSDETHPDGRGRGRRSGRMQLGDGRPQAVRARLRQGAAAAHRPAAGGEALRAVHLRGLRPSRPLQAPQAERPEGRQRRRRRGPRPEPAQGTPRGIPARAAEDGWHALSRQGHLRPGPRRQDPLPGQEGQLHGAELRTDHRRDRQRDQAEGNRSRQRRRLGRAAERLAAAGGSRKRGQKVITTLRKEYHDRFVTALAALVLAFAAPAAWAQAAKNAVESINFSQTQGGKILVKVGMKEPLAAVPQGFAVTNPPRIAIDLPDTVNGLPRNQVEAGEGDLKSVSIVQTNNRTRLVINLARNLTYTQSIDGKMLLVTVDASQPQAGTGTVATAPSTAGATFAEAPAGSNVRYNLRDVDFRRGQASEGRVVIDLSSANIGIDIRQQGRQLVVDFINTNVPRNLVRRLDVGDFGTPVRFVDTFEQGGNARMVIEPRGLWEYSAYQTDTQFIVEVKPVKEDPNRLVQSSTPGYSGEKLSLNFQNVEVRAVLQVIADFTGLNIITSDTVGGNLTLRLKDVPWDQALDIILQAK